MYLQAQVYDPHMPCHGLFSGLPALSFETGILTGTWTSQNQLGCLASKLQASFQLYLPSAVIKSFKHFTISAGDLTSVLVLM